MKPTYSLKSIPFHPKDWVPDGKLDVIYMMSCGNCDAT